MKFPQWAPIELIRYRESRLRTLTGKYYIPDNLIAARNKDVKYESYSEYEFELEMREREQESWRVGVLRPEHSAELLSTLLTDDKMKTVWRSLDKRIEHPGQYVLFYRTCMEGICGWLVDQKHTPTERVQYFNDIHTHAATLREMLNGVKEFTFYDTSRLVDKEKIDLFLSYLDFAPTLKTPEQRDSYIRHGLRCITPSIDFVLSDIEKKALEYAEVSHYVKRPNSRQAAVHYFIRHLSRYLSNEFGQPLHDVVSTAAFVIFEKDVETVIDADYVRKIVN